MRKKYKVSADIELEVEAPNKKQVNNLIEHFKNNAKFAYESFGSTGTIITTNMDIKDICESE